MNNPPPPPLVPPPAPRPAVPLPPPVVQRTEEPQPAAPRDPRRALAAGSVVGEYTVTSQLGMGGFGITYRARHNIRGTVVVVKEHMPRGMALRENASDFVTCASPEQESLFRATMEEFMEEVTVMQGLQHPGIVPILSAFEANGTAYYVMPYVYGKPLEVPEHVSLARTERAVEARNLKRILLALLDTLEYMEQHNVVHRDIKPENIIVKPDGDPVLLDFGSARQLSETKVYSNIYTPGFCAPEQAGSSSDAEMSAALGPWTDIYALGATFAYLITRMLPPRAEVRLVSSPDPYKPLAARPDLREVYGDAFLHAVDRAMEKEPHNRWQSAAAWRTAVEAGILPTNPRQLRRYRWLACGTLASLVAFGGISLWALKERRDAVQMYGNSLHFTEGILYDFNEELADIPGSTALQLQLGNHLRSYLHNMEQLPVGNDEKLQRALAAAWKNLGSVNMAQGKLEEATEALLRATALEEALISADPQDPRRTYDLARTWLLRAEVARRRNMDAEARKLVSSALAGLKLLCMGDSGNPDYLCALGDALEDTAVMAQREGNTPLRKQALEEMLDLYRGLIQRYKQHGKTRMGLAYALQQRSQLALEESDFITATTMLEEAHTIFADLTAAYPYRMSYKKGLAMTYYTRGNLCNRRSMETDAPAKKDELDLEALNAYGHHLDLARELESLDPNNTEYPYLQCRTYAYMADTLTRVGQPNLAVSYCQVLLQKAENLVNTAPDNVDYALLADGAWRGLALAHSSSAEHYGKAAEEMSRYRDDIARRLKAAPNNLTLKQAYIDALTESAHLAHLMGRHQQAREWLETAESYMRRMPDDVGGYDEQQSRLRQVKAECTDVADAAAPAQQ